MRKGFMRLFILTLVLCLTAGQCAAFDLQLGRLDFGPQPAHAPAPPRVSEAAVGAMFTIPFGDSGSRPSAATVNGQDISRFTEQNAKDTFIVLFLVGTLVAVGMLTTSAVSNSF